MLVHGKVGPLLEYLPTITRGGYLGQYVGQHVIPKVVHPTMH